MKLLLYDVIPCWYELSWLEEERSLLLRVHEDFIENTKPIPDNASIIQAYKRAFSFQTFVGDLRENFGFDNAFVNRGEREKFREFVVEIPIIKKTTNENCENCKGSGKDDFFDRECLYCEGEGKKFYYDWRGVNAVAASLGVFFLLSFSAPKKDTSASFPQLFIIESSISRDRGASLGGTFSISLVDWIKSLNANKKAVLNQIEGVMEDIYCCMMGISEQRRDYLKHSFRVRVGETNGYFYLDCPGDACGIYPSFSSSFSSEKQAYEFSSHNVDTPAQLITLIAGLAKLHDLARQEVGQL